MCIANPFIAVLAILGWGLVAVVAIIVLMILIALVRGLHAVILNKKPEDDNDGGY